MVECSSSGVVRGVLEPLQANPPLVKITALSARSEIVEGVIVEEGLLMGVYIGQSTVFMTAKPVKFTMAVYQQVQ